MNSRDPDHVHLPFFLPAETSLRAKKWAQERQESSMVASELASDIERRMHKGPFSAVLVFMHVTESGARGYSQTLFTSVQLWAECK